MSAILKKIKGKIFFLVRLSFPVRFSFLINQSINRRGFFVIFGYPEASAGEKREFFPEKYCFFRLVNSQVFKTGAPELFFPNFKCRMRFDEKSLREMRAAAQNGKFGCVDEES